MINISLVKAFTRDSNAGNPAGVVVDALGLSDEQMQEIARELGFSESAFVFPSKLADYKLRFFATNQEVDYCGHATVATYHELFELPDNVSKTSLTQETRAGVFAIEKLADCKIMMTQKDPVFGSVEEDRSLIAGLLGIAVTDIDPNLSIQVVTTNASKLMIPIVSEEALKKITPRLSAITDYINSHEGKGLYCFAMSSDSNYDLIARFFNPAVGINEDPATGVAAGPLGCYADKYIYGGQKKQIRINQGMWMGKSSDIYVDLTDGVKVGGYAARFGIKSYE